MHNTCFPESLVPAYNRICRRAFEQFNRTEMIIPNGHSEWALGIGSSAIDEIGTLSNIGNSFRINGQDFVIKKMKN